MTRIDFLVISAAFLAAVVADVAATGGGVIVLAVLVTAFGAREAVPLYAVARTMSRTMSIIAVS